MTRFRINHSRLVYLSMILTILTVESSVNGQTLVFRNSSSLVYSLPSNISSSQAKAVAEQIRMSLLRESVSLAAGTATSIFAGNIAGVIYSVVQQIPTVGNAGQIDFEILPNPHLINAGSSIGLAISVDTGDCPGGIAFSIDSPRKLYGWSKGESRTLLSTDEVWRVLDNLPSTQFLLITRRPISAPKTGGTYRIAVSTGCYSGKTTRDFNVIESY